MSVGRAQSADTRTLTILAFSATAGTLVELYDFFIYGYAAASAFPAIFFPKLPPTQALVFSFLAFGADFQPVLPEHSSLAISAIGRAGNSLFCSASVSSAPPLV